MSISPSEPTQEHVKHTYSELLHQATPVMISSTMEIIIMTVNLHYATTSTMTAGLGLSMILIHSLGGSFIYGFNLGFSNFASRAFGAHNKAKYDKFVAQGLFSLFGLLMCLICLGFLSYRLSLLFGQADDVSLDAYHFFVYQMPGLVAFFCADFIRVFLNSQGIYKPLLYTNIACIIAHMFFSMIFSRMYNGYGVVISTNLTFFTYFFVLLYTEMRSSTWKLDFAQLRAVFSAEWHQGYREFAYECSHVAYPLCLDLFMFQIMALYVGSYQDPDQTAAHIAFSNIATINASTVMGLSITCMIKMGRQIGRNDAVAAKQLAVKSISLSWLLVYILYAIQYFFRDKVAQFYADNHRVHMFMEQVWPVYFVLNLFDVIQFMGSHVLRALRFGDWVTKVFIISYYLIGCSLMFVYSRMFDSKLGSTWAAFCSGSVAISIFMWLKWKSIVLKDRVQQIYDQIKSGHLEMELLEH